MQKFHENLIPGIINKNLIDSLIRNQRRKSELGEILNNEDTHFDRIEVIRIEYLSNFVFW